MALSAERSIFGIHSMTPYNRTTGVPDWGTFKVLGNMSMDLSSDFIKLQGGSNSYPFAVEKGFVNAEVSGVIRSYRDKAFELFLGASVTENSAEATGNVSAIANKSGTSIVNATTGIASVGVTSADEADLKSGLYVVQYASATTVNVYCLSDVDFLRGTDEEFSDDTLLLDSAVTIPGTSATVAMANFGLEFTGGSGSIAFTATDTATFEVRPVNAGSSVITVGATGTTVTEFGCVFLAEKRSDGSIWELDAARCFAFGYPISMGEKAFAEAEITINMLYDSALNRVFRARAITI